MNRPPSQSLVEGEGEGEGGGECCFGEYLLIILYVWFKFVMPNSLNVPSWLLMKGFLAPICLAIRLCQDVRSGGYSLEFSA